MSHSLRFQISYCGLQFSINAVLFSFAPTKILNGISLILQAWQFTQGSLAASKHPAIRSVHCRTWRVEAWRERYFHYERSARENGKCLVIQTNLLSKAQAWQLHKKIYYLQMNMQRAGLQKSSQQKPYKSTDNSIGQNQSHQQTTIKKRYRNNRN